jgi:hypothetical protein
MITKRKQLCEQKLTGCELPLQQLTSGQVEASCLLVLCRIALPIRYHLSLKVKTIVFIMNVHDSSILDNQTMISFTKQSLSNSK